MKLSPLFTVKDNRLYKLADNSVVDLAQLPCLTAKNLTYNTNPFFIIAIPWSMIELEAELYNEDFLAKLRDFLKQFEEKNQFAIIKPVVDKPLNSSDDDEAFTSAFNHTARRIKDCTALIGLELPKELLAKGTDADSPAAAFMETLAVKHAHYVYFADKNNVSDQAAAFSELPVAFY